MYMIPYGIAENFRIFRMIALYVKIKTCESLNITSYLWLRHLLYENLAYEIFA